MLFRPFLDVPQEGIEPTPLSYPGDQPLGYPALLALVLASLPQHEPFILLGESFSGPLAIMGAASGLSNLRAVILCASFVRSPHPYVPKPLARLIGPAPFRLFPFFAQAKALLGGYSSSHLLTLLREAHSAIAPEVFAHRLRSVLTVDVRQELLGLKCPVLYIRPTRDVVVPFWNAREVRALLPTATVARIRAPHLVLQTQPTLSAMAISSFVRSRAV